MKINKQGYVILKDGELEHRIIIERFIERKLLSTEVIHHIDLDKTNNNIENLWLFKNQKEHSKWHIKLKKFPYLTNPMKRQMRDRWNEYQ
jgi:5-methylcytosine-specific restriction endonuclease McrA